MLPLFSNMIVLTFLKRIKIKGAFDLLKNKTLNNIKIFI